jgi:hypothetical protein
MKNKDYNLPFRNGKKAEDLSVLTGQVSTLNSSLADNTQQLDEMNSKTELRGIATYAKTEHTSLYPVNIPKAKQMGFNALQVSVGVTISSQVASKQFTDDFVLSIINIAKDAGFEHIVLKLHCANENITSQGVLTSYETVVVQYAQMCETNGIEALYISNEQPSGTGNYRTDWQRIINSIRAVYSGKIGSALVYKEVETHVFLDLLDVIGFNTYPAMTYKGLSATVTECSNGWYGDKQSQYNYIKAMEDAKQKYNKEIAITEVGIQPFEGRLAFPGEAALPTTLNEDTQELFYKATMPIITHLSDTISSYFIWELNESYSPLGRKAEAILASYL